MVTPGLPPVPHVGGPVLPPGVMTVIIGGLPAATVGAMCTCVGPPDSIVVGSLGVFIGGRMAARVLDKTVHGGQLSFGFPTVKIGDLNAVAAATIFPGQQSYQNCGVQSAEQLIHQATGLPIDEDMILATAVGNGWANSSNPDPSQWGGTGATGRQNLLNEYGVSSSVVPTTPENISDALVNQQGIIANVNPGVLWNNPRHLNGGHAITVVDGEWDEHGNLTHVTINDTGNGDQGRVMPIDDFMAAANAKRGGSSLNVTDDPIWTEVR